MGDVGSYCVLDSDEVGVDPGSGLLGCSAG